MGKKTLLTALVAMVIIGCASLSFAFQVDGLVSGRGPALPNGIQAAINPGGLGDSLLYGYYNVRGVASLVEVVNTSSVDGAKVRVVFRNAKNSKECLDFSVCLSRGDKWTAVLLDNGVTAAICNFDTDTVTAPTIPATCQAFKYEGAGGFVGVTADDCREGYFEIVGLSTIPTYDKDTCTANAVTCPKTEALCRDFRSSIDVANVLFGEHVMFDLSNLGTYAYNATAVADTSLVEVTVPAGTADISIPAAMGTGRGAVVGCDEADYIFTKSNIIAPYDIIAALGGETEIIITFPTRLACHNFNDDLLFDAIVSTPAIDYCTNINLAVWNDKEKRQDVTDFSPSQGRCLPWEVNVIKIGASNIWNSTVAQIVSLGSGFDLGWLDINLAVAPHETIYGGMLTRGLPAVSYYTQAYVGGEATFMLPSFFKTDIAPAQ